MIALYVLSKLFGNVFHGTLDISFLHFLTDLANWIDAYPRESAALGYLIENGTKLLIPVTATITILNFIKKRKQKD